MHQLITLMGKKATTSRLCLLLDVSRSGFYAAQSRRAQPAVVTEEQVHLRAAFDSSGHTYGSRRLCQAMRARGFKLGRHRTRTLMRQLQLRVCWRRKFCHTTDSKHSLPVAPNLLDRQFRPPAANQAWACDITYIRTGSGWLYLAAVLDLYSRKVVGWAMAPSMPAQLACSALQMAITLRQPAPGLMVHSDRGSQHASAAHQQLLADYQIIGSISRNGNRWDNAVMERFFLNLKMERVWQRSYANHAEARCDITDYIVNFYNTQRLHSALGYLSPLAYEQANA